MDFHDMTRLTEGKAIGASVNRGFVATFNFIVDVLQRIEGIGGVKIKKAGTCWKIADTPSIADAPSGSGDVSEYTEQDVVTGITFNGDGTLGLTLKKALVNESASPTSSTVSTGYTPRADSVVGLTWTQTTSGGYASASLIPTLATVLVKNGTVSTGSAIFTARPYTVPSA